MQGYRYKEDDQALKVSTAGRSRGRGCGGYRGSRGRGRQHVNKEHIE
ncbi:hypothetical protein A2U01_0037428, partial [Trifolium medium]|nr:hypothetical protein [Trifolium medium]